MLSGVVLHAADFRNVSWGMVPSAVKRAETAKLVEEHEGELVYNTSLGGVAVAVRYNFSSGRLARSRYEFVKQYRESEKYVEAYEALQAQLVKKYGEPVLREVRCDDTFYRDFPGRWGTGIVVGKLSEEAVWRVGAMDVRHEMRALPGGTVGHFVEYRPYVVPRGELQNAEVYGAL